MPGREEKRRQKECDDGFGLGIPSYFLGDYFRVNRFLFYQGIFKKGTEMREIAVWILLVPLLCLNLTGCAPLIVASVAAGAIGGYVIVKNDTVQGDLDKSYDGLWEAALTVSKIRGNIKYEDSAKGYIELDAGGTKVGIRVLRLTGTITRLRIRARKHHLPNLDLAKDIFKKITEEVK